jgi:3-oxoacyl-[acyl-carrier-protein] synthase II
MKRVVVTGLGVVSPLGHDAHAMFHRLLKGECGIQSLNSDPLFRDLPVQIAAKITDPITIDYEEESKLSNFMKYAMAATDSALKDAGWHALPSENTVISALFIPLGSLYWFRNWRFI